MARLRRPDPRSDEALVEACNAGDAREAAKAFEALYLRHKDYVLRIALRFVPDPDTALDVLQETFAYLLKRFPPTGGGLQLTAKMTSLLYPVARNTAITALRKARRFPGTGDVAPDDLPAPEGANTGASGDLHRRASGDIHRVLAALPANQRETLQLRFVDDLSLGEIAEVLDIPLGTVKSRLHFGIASLKASDIVKDLREE